MLAASDGVTSGRRGRSQNIAAAPNEGSDLFVASTGPPREPLCTLSHFRTCAATKFSGQLRRRDLGADSPPAWTLLLAGTARDAPTPNLSLRGCQRPRRTWRCSWTLPIRCPSNARGNHVGGAQTPSHAATENQAHASVQVFERPVAHGGRVLAAVLRGSPAGRYRGHGPAREARYRSLWLVTECTS